MSGREVGNDHRTGGVPQSRPTTGTVRGRYGRGVYFGPTHHHLRISLDEVEPEVWRTLVVASDIALPELGDVLVAVMGWEGYHLHQYVAGGMYFGDDDDETSRFTIAYERITLEQIAGRAGGEFEWHYDFGDGWTHRVVVERVGEPQQARVPVCLDGARACPPEDCGGPHGYADLLTALADPGHDEHDRMVEWVGGGFDPDAFDRTAVNERLRSLGSDRPDRC